MALYKKCPICGANLDPGEKCDCQSETTKLDEKNEFMSKEKEEFIRMEAES